VAAGTGHAARVAAGIFATRVLGYVRERVFAHYFGNGPAADAFRAALRIPNVVRNLLGEGTLSASFIPVYAGLEARGDREAARAVAGAVLGLLLAASGVLAAIGIALAPAITTAVAAGFDEPTRRLTITLVRILFPMTGLMVVSAWCLGVLNTHRRFFLPYAAPALWNVAGIVALVAAGTWLITPDLPLDQRFERLALALAWGTVVGAVLQVAVQLPTCWRLVGGSLALRPSLASPATREVLTAWSPVVLGAGVAQVAGLIDTQLGSFAGPGGVASLGYAQLVQTLPISLFGVSVAAVSLPALSVDAAGAGGATALRERLAGGFRRIAFFVVPCAFAFMALGSVIVALLFETGRFGRADSRLVGAVLAAYGIGLLGPAAAKLFASGFYALRDTRTPVRISVVALATSAVIAVALIRPLGPVGIAIGSSVGGTLNLVLQVTLLGRRVGRILGGDDWQHLGSAVGAALVAAAAGAGTAIAAAAWGVVPRGLAAMAAFGAVYFVVGLALGHPDARRLWMLRR
jgi:putative peptidoglycan lipid II flippase